MWDPRQLRGMAQVGRNWEGGKRGRRRGKEVGDRTRNREKERPTQRHMQRDGETGQGDRETERDRNRRVYGRQCTHA